jgi:hypothetical protein
VLACTVMVQEKSENDDYQNMGFMGGEMGSCIELDCRARVCYRVCKCPIFPSFTVKLRFAYAKVKILIPKHTPTIIFFIVNLI